MAMDFELTISGICVIVLKSKTAEPSSPTAVDILCPKSGGHKPRLSYRPEGVSTQAEPELFVDPQGIRIASLDLSGKVVRLDFGTNPQDKFFLNWGTGPAQVPPKEKWMRWVPSDEDLGLKGIRIADPGKLPSGASARLTLQPGDIEGVNVVRDRGTGDFALWNFPGSGYNRAVANEVVYRAEGVQHVKVMWGGGGPSESLTISRTGKLAMAISNDLAVVPKNYNANHTTLDHLEHVEALAEPPLKVKIPTIKSTQRTGRPICNQVFFIDKT